MQSYNEDMAIWLRGAGFPVEEIARMLGANARRVARDTRRYARFDLSAWLAFEATLFRRYDAEFRRQGAIANGKRALAAFRRRKINERR